MIDDNTKLKSIVGEYEKSQKNIPPIWVGEGWYKSVPNSFNYFASGFEAGLNYQYLTHEEVEAIKSAINACDETLRYYSTSTLRNLLERIKNKNESN